MEQQGGGVDVPEREQAAEGGSVPPGAGPGLRVSPPTLGDEGYDLELSAVTFVDVAGVGVLARAADRLGPGRRIVVRRPPAALPRILATFWAGLPGIEVSTS
ncbi:STAS domain-containing protein [Streptomyces anandii]|uniref:STAS domain-containing protein n=1 Tax=Streptomyces anandii TaxID=285454 RepID=UPI0036BA53C6